MATKKTKTKTSKVEPSGDHKLNLEKIDERLVHEACARYGVDPGLEPLAARVTALQKAIKKATPEMNVADCSTCGGESDNRDSACPFCGDGEIDTTPAEVVTKVEPKPEVKAATPKAATTKAATPKAATPKAATKAEPAKTATTSGQVLVAVPKKGPAEAVLAKAPELDGAVAEVRRLKQQVVQDYWELGRAIFQIYDGKLHLLRRTEYGKPMYDSWSRFCAEELKMSPQHSYALMDVSVNFTRDDIAELGTTKLTPILRLPQSERAEMLKRAKTLPASKVIEEVRRLAGGKRRETGRKKVEGQGRGRPKKAEVRAPKGGVTVAMMLGRVQVKLHARPKKKGDEEKRAMKLADDPHGTLVLLNGVEQFFKVSSDAKGQLILIVETRRTPA